MKKATVRADKKLSSLFPGLTKGQRVQALEKHLVTCQGRALKKGDKLPIEAQLEIEPLRKHLSSLEDSYQGPPIHVLYEDAEKWIVHKPSHLHSTALSLFETHTLTHWALKRDPQLATRFGNPLPEVTPHRLDFHTQGIQVVTKNPTAFLKWRGYFSKKLCQKTYLAWCFGRPSTEGGTLHHEIAHHSRQKDKMVVVQNHIAYRTPKYSATLSWHVVSRLEDRFLAKIQMVSGLTHQIRVQMAALNFPLVGDKKYDEAFSKRLHQKNHHQLLAVEIHSPEGLFITADPTFSSQQD